MPTRLTFNDHVPALWARLGSSAVLAAGLFLSAVAAAAAPAETPYIFGGTSVQACAWPTTVRLDGCTGTLVSHNLIVYAAHCGADHQVARFGSGDERVVALSGCVINPEYSKSKLGQGIDWAYCRVAYPQDVADLPIVPVLTKDEADVLAIGTSVTLVGYGANDQGLPFGTKMEVQAPIVELGLEAKIGGDGLDSCQGDSGGPAFVRMGDGSWRVFGITSYGGRCGEGGYYSLLHRASSWIESHSGLRLSRADDLDLTSLPLDPGRGYGSWDQGCQGGPVHRSDQDGSAPAVEILTPTLGSSYLPGTARIDMIAQVHSARALAEVRVLLNHEMVVQGQASTVTLGLENLEDGQHLLEVFARDDAGHWGVDATWVRLHVMPDSHENDDDNDSEPEIDNTQKDSGPTLNDRETLSCAVTPHRSCVATLGLALALLARPRRRTTRHLRSS